MFCEQWILIVAHTAMTASQEKGSKRTAWMDYKYKSCRITTGHLPEGTGQAFWTYDTSCDIEADASSLPVHPDLMGASDDRATTVDIMTDADVRMETVFSDVCEGY